MKVYVPDVKVFVKGRRRMKKGEKGKATMLCIRSTRDMATSNGFWLGYGILKSVSSSEKFVACCRSGFYVSEVQSLRVDVMGGFLG